VEVYKEERISGEKNVQRVGRRMPAGYPQDNAKGGWEDARRVPTE
jgi:hypothetical protein